MKKNTFWKGKGFYMTLSLFVLAAVAASALAIRGMVGRLETQNNTNSEASSWAEEQQDVNKAQSGVPVLPAQSSSASSASSSGASSGAQSTTQKSSATGAAAQTSSFTLPVEGQVTAAYSGDELVYNQTLADWRTHNGLDITAAAGAPVKAAMAGTVTAVRQDAQWGTVVEITSDDGELLRYCGLAEDAQVGEGTMVKQGDTLGKLGQVPAETDLEPHLHFEVEKDGRLIDPEELMK